MAIATKISSGSVARVRAIRAVVLVLTITLANFLLRVVLAPWLGDEGTLVLLLPGIVCSAAMFGLIAGISATLLSCLLAAWYLLPPIYSLAVTNPGDDVRLVVLAVEGVMFSLIIDALKRSHVRTESALEDLDKAQIDRNRFFDIGPELYVIADFNGYFLQVNQSWSRLLGWSPDELTTHPWLEMVHPDDREMAVAEGKRLMEGAETVNFENRYRTRDGQWRWLSWRAKGYPSEQLLYAVATDTTTQREAQERLLESEARYRRVFEDSPSGLYCTAPDGEIILANPALLQMLGYDSADQLVGRSAEDSNADRKRFLQEIENRGEIHRFEAEWKKKDGSLIKVRENARAIRDAEGRSLYYEGAVEDVTEEAKLAAQLSHSQKLEAVGRLAGGVAHDFNNLLTIILGYAELLSHSLPPADSLQSKVDAIKSAGTRAARVTAQLLAFSRKQVAQTSVVSLNDLVENIGSMLRRLLGEDISIETRLAKDLDRVRVDPNQLEQVIMNLSVNARDAMPGGGVLTIETRNFDLDQRQAARLGLMAGRYVLLTVSDTGVGMDEATKNRIFEPFFTTKPEGKGTGLGLSMVYGTIRQSDGAVSVYSEPGQGTSIHVYLPGRAEESTREAAPEERALPTGVGTILLVEDDESLRTLAHEVLTSVGYNVILASDGVDALKRESEYDGRIDLVLTDVVMPRMKGPELVTRLQARRPDLKFVYTSGYHDHAVLSEETMNGGANFLHKPYMVSDLLRMVGDVLATSRETVLVIDDEAEIREMIREALEQAGYRVVERSNATGLDRIVAEEKAAAVILDLVMPESEGLETIPLLRKTNPGLKVVAISGAFEGSFLRVARMLGADAVLQKPFTASALVEELRGVLAPGS